MAHQLYQCNRFHHQTSLTARTILDSTKLPLTTLYLAIYLLTQRKNSLSALRLSRELGVSYNTAWKLKHKIMQVMFEREQDKVLAGPSMHSTSSILRVIWPSSSTASSANVAMDDDENLPWPDPALIEAWWQQEKGAYQNGQGYFLGQPISEQGYRLALSKGQQRQRIVAAYGLARFRPTEPLFPTSAPAWRQQRLLAEMR